MEAVGVRRPPPPLLAVHGVMDRNRDRRRGEGAEGRVEAADDRHTIWMEEKGSSLFIYSPRKIYTKKEFFSLFFFAPIL